MYEKKYCWSILFRLYHWAFALSIVILVCTGFLINTPLFNSMLEGSRIWPMAYTRYLHFLAGYLFTAAVIIRFFLFVFGNPQERITSMLPISAKNRKNFYDTLLHYGYISNYSDHRLGHNVLAGITYSCTLFVALFQLLSGFYLLFPELPAFEKWGVALFTSQQNGRFIHHLLMWWFIIFSLVHIYLLIWNDITEKNGLISSIITGFKFKRIQGWPE